jgi:peptide/nickel transport system substrate-binding protein
MYDSLVYPGLDGKIVPGVAEEGWTASADGLTWTFTIKKGVKFHDGTEMKASDVVFSTNRMLELGTGFAYLFTGYIDAVKATGDYTVEFTLKKPFAPFLSILPRLYILNEKLVKANLADGSYGDNKDYGKAWLAEHDAGSGAYLCDAMKVQDRLVMKKYTAYFGTMEKNAPDTVELISGTEASTVRTLMSSSQLEISDQWQTNEAYDALDKLDGVSVNSFSSGQMVYLMLNTKKAPTDDVHVRRAIAALIDYSQVITALFPGFKTADSPIPTGLPGHADGLPSYQFSIDTAKQELAASAYAGKLADISVDIAWIAEVPDEEKLALLIQANAAQIGLKVNVVKVPWGTYVDNVSTMENTPNAAVCFISPDYDEAGAMLYQRFHSDTAGTWQQTEWLQDTTLDTAITTALTTMDQTARFNLYADLQKQVMDNVWGISVAMPIEKHAYCDYIVWPAMERGVKGESVPALLGYNFLFRTFQINK